MSCTVSCTTGGAPLEQLRSQGYVIFERLVPEALIDQVCEELAPWFAATPRCRGDFYGWNTTRCGAVLLKSAASRELLLHPGVRFLVGQILDAHCDWHQLNLSQAVRIHPGERRQIPHRDDEMWPGEKGGAEYLVNVMWALSDFTRENGATLIWPCDRVAAPTRTMDPGAAIAASMPRGSALLYLGSVTHCGGANRTRAPRTGLIFSYCLGWLKQYENAFLTYPPHVAAGFGREIRDLLGYRIHRPNLGGYEGQDPAVLFETNSHALAATDCLGNAAAAELKAFREAFP
jgi:Phytanoyl-CoA dioxygenase (PhyH)